MLVVSNERLLMRRTAVQFSEGCSDKRPRTSRVSNFRKTLPPARMREQKGNGEGAREMPCIGSSHLGNS